MELYFFHSFLSDFKDYFVVERYVFSGCTLLVFDDFELVHELSGKSALSTFRRSVDCHDVMVFDNFGVLDELLLTLIQFLNDLILRRVFILNLSCLVQLIYSLIIAEMCQPSLF